MYDIIEKHIKDGKAKELIHSHFGGPLFATYEEAQKEIEEFLVPHSVELGRGYGLDLNKNVSVEVEDGTPVRWTVHRNDHYHTEYTIRKAGS